MKNIKPVRFFFLTVFWVTLITTPLRSSSIRYEAVADGIPSSSIIKKLLEIPDFKLLTVRLKHGLPLESVYKRLVPFLPDVALMFYNSYPASYEIDRINRYVPPGIISAHLTPPTPFEVKSLNRLNPGTDFILVTPKYHYANEALTFNTLNMNRRVKFTFPSYPVEPELRDISLIENADFIFHLELYPGYSQTSILNKLHLPIDLEILNLYPDEAKISQLLTLNNLRSLKIYASSFPTENQTDNVKSVPGKVFLVLESAIYHINSRIVDRLNRICNLSEVTFIIAGYSVDKETLNILKDLRADVILRIKL